MKSALLVSPLLLEKVFTYWETIKFKAVVTRFLNFKYFLESLINSLQERSVSYFASNNRFNLLIFKNLPPKYPVQNNWVLYFMQKQLAEPATTTQLCHLKAGHSLHISVCSNSVVCVLVIHAHSILKRCTSNIKIIKSVNFPAFSLKYRNFFFLTAIMCQWRI